MYRTNFNNTNLSSDGILVKSLSNRDAVIACGLSKSSPEFLCLIMTLSSGSSDVFLIDINNTGSISGKYEYCLAGTSSSSCATDALLTPDGTVTGSVIRSSSTAIFEVNTQSRAAIGLDENHQFEKKLIEKLDNLDDETENPITESPTPEALQKIENAIEFIRTFIR